MSTEAMFQLLANSAGDCAVFSLDLRGRVASWNRGAERFTGYSSSEMVGQPFSIFYPDEPAAGAGAPELEIAARTGRFEGEGRCLLKGGASFWAHTTIEAVAGDDGRITGFAVALCDLSKRRTTADQLNEQERFRQLIENIQDYAIFLLDRAGNVATWNAGAARFKGYKAEEIIGSHFSRFYPEEDVRAGKCEHELAVAAATGRFEDEGWRIRKDGSRFWANVIITALRDPAGEVIGFGKVTRDLTERRRSELESARRWAAEQANRAKDEFLAMLGHELRNPLAPIVSALQLLKLRGDAELARELQVIERQVKQMTRIVEDLLDVSRISRNKMELKRELIDLREPLAQAAEIAIPLLERKKHQFEVRIPDAPLAVNGDSARLTQVFANLLNNAAKYTDEGGRVEMSVAVKDAHVEVEVQDNGTGIDAELLDRVFELFVQGYQDSDRAEGGLGIGLSLVQSLVRLHGGQVAARSEGKGRGSTFTVRLPLAEQLPAAEPGDEAVDLGAAAARSKVLLVDDNEDARELLAEVLTRYGYHVESAPDGAAALDLLGRWQPDAALLDIGLPVMDGYELAQRIRQRPDLASIRLIALTGYGQPADKGRARAAGFDVHLVKPIDIRRLLGHLQ